MATRNGAKSAQTGARITFYEKTSLWWKREWNLPWAILGRTIREVLWLQCWHLSSGNGGNTPGFWFLYLAADNHRTNGFMGPGDCVMRVKAHNLSQWKAVKCTQCGWLRLIINWGSYQIIKAFAWSRNSLKVDSTKPLWYESIISSCLFSNVTFRPCQSCHIACLRSSQPVYVWLELTMNRTGPGKGKRLFPHASDSPPGFQKRVSLQNRLSFPRQSANLSPCHIFLDAVVRPCDVSGI